MDFFKIFFEQDVTAVGLAKFKDKKDDKYSSKCRTDYRKQYFKPNYSNNFFLL